VISLNLTARVLLHKIAKLNITIELPEGMQLVQGRTFFLGVEEVKERYLVNVSIDIPPGVYKIPLMGDGIIEVGEGLYRTISFTEELEVKVHRFKITAKISAAPTEAEPGSLVKLMALVSNRLPYPGRYMALSNITIKIVSEGFNLNRTVTLPQLLPLEDKKLSISLVVPSDAKPGPNMITMIVCYTAAERRYCQIDSTSVLVVKPAAIHFKVSAPDSAANGSTITVNITVLNTGSYPATDITVKLLNLETGKIIAYKSIGELPPGKKAAISLSGVVLGPSTTRLAVKLAYMSEGSVKPAVKEYVVRVHIAPRKLPASWQIAAIALATLAMSLYAAYRVKSGKSK